MFVLGENGPKLAVMVVVPVAMPDTTPAAFTVATEPSPEDHVVLTV